MESKKINQLATELAPELSDLTIIGDPTTGISKKITLSQMASLFTGTVEEYANLASFPLVGTADTIYIALDTNIIYRWNTGTSAYVELSPNIVTSLVFNDANGFDGTISLVGSTATLTITTALTQGSIGFIGASGALTQDNSNFFWDNTNKRLGINTNAPTTAIDVFGSGIIGRLNGTSTNNAFLGFASAGSNKWSIGNVQSDHRFRIYSEANAAELVSVLQTGEVGIGIANPLTKLHIFGGASALIANLDANTSVAKSISFRSGNSSRINLEVSGTESGSNAGANFFLRTYTDAGSLIETPFQITRATGLATFKQVSVNNTNPTTVLGGQLGVNSSNAYAVGNIAGIQFGANDSSATYSTYAAIQMITIGDNSGALRFSTRLNSGSYNEWIRLTPEGRTGFGTDAPDAGVTIQTDSSILNSLSLRSSRAYNTSPDVALSFKLKYNTAGDFATTALIVSYKDNTTSGNSAGGLDFYTNPNGSISPVKKWRMTSQGWLAFGTATSSITASAPIDLGVGSNAAGILMQDQWVQIITSSFVVGSRYFYGSDNYGEIYANNAGFNVYAKSNKDLNLSSYANYVVRLSGGDQINTLGSGGASGTPMYLNFQGNGAIKAGTSGNTTLYAGSDLRIKQNINIVDSVIDKVLQLTPKTYEYKDIKDDKLYYGFIAQEVEKIFPELVRTAVGVTMCNDEEIIDQKSIESFSLVWASILTKAIQELNAKIESLK